MTRTRASTIAGTSGHSRRATLTVAALGLTLTLAACGQSGSEPAAPDSQDTTASTSDDDAAGTDAATPDDGSSMTEDDASATRIPRPGDNDPGLPLGPVPESISSREDVQAAVADEVERSSVTAEEVEIAGYAAVTWPDGSLGCGQEGMMYTQALVPGHLLILEVRGEYHHYHAAEGKPFTYCAQPSPPLPYDLPGSTSDM